MDRLIVRFRHLPATGIYRKPTTLVPPRGTLNGNGVLRSGVASTVAVCSPLSRRSRVPARRGRASVVETRKVHSALPDDAEALPRRKNLDARSCSSPCGDEAVHVPAKPSDRAAPGTTCTWPTVSRIAPPTGPRHVGNRRVQRLESGSMANPNSPRAIPRRCAARSAGKRARRSFRVPAPCRSSPAVGGFLSLAAVDDDRDDGRHCSRILLKQSGLARAASTAARRGSGAPSPHRGAEAECGEASASREGGEKGNGRKGANSIVIVTAQPIEQRDVTLSALYCRSAVHHDVHAARKDSSRRPLVRRHGRRMESRWASIAQAPTGHCR